MRNNPGKKYKADDLAILIPTKDRPQKLQNLLNSLAAQKISCGRIIIVDGGQSVKEIVTGFLKQLPVEYYECRPPGQIRQRNMAISLLDNHTPLVAFLDDDIVFEENALGAMLDFWNRCDPETAGVSFNVVNASAENCSRLKSLLLLGSPKPGRVLKSGLTTSNCNVSHDVKAEWLCGGATIWRQAILKKFPHTEISTPWAIGEDIIFSYPVGKKYPLYVCADAKVRHEHAIDYVTKAKHRFHGYTQTIWLFYFVEKNKELSRTFFLWTLMVKCTGRLLRGLFGNRNEDIEFAIGQIKGVRKGLAAIVRGQNIRKILNEDVD